MFIETNSNIVEIYLSIFNAIFVKIIAFPSNVFYSNNALKKLWSAKFLLR